RVRARFGPYGAGAPRCAAARIHERTRAAAIGMLAGSSARPRASVAARGAIVLLGARVFFMLSGYVITVVLARGLGPAAYGTYGVLISLLLWLEVSGSLGIPRAAGKMIPGAAD